MKKMCFVLIFCLSVFFISGCVSNKTYTLDNVKQALKKESLTLNKIKNHMPIVISGNHYTYSLKDKNKSYVDIYIFNSKKEQEKGKSQFENKQKNSLINMSSVVLISKNNVLVVLFTSESEETGTPITNKVKAAIETLE